jgi:hypothetical protein
MKLVFLTANFVPQHVGFIQTLIDLYAVEIHSFHISRSFKYVPEDIDGLFTYRKDDHSRQEMLLKFKRLGLSLFIFLDMRIKIFFG